MWVYRCGCTVLKGYINELLLRSHSNKVRYRWNKNDIALWDNFIFRTATNDYYQGDIEHTGMRTVAIGERPCFDRSSRRRNEDLGEDLLG